MQMTRLRIDDPCHENWDGMEREDARRFCGQCQKHVHDLSAMTEAQAEELLARRGDAKMCVRYSVDASGTIVFRKPAPPVVPIAALRRRPSKLATMAPAAAAIAMALAACTPHDRGSDVVGEIPAMHEPTKPEPTPPQAEIPPVKPTPVIEVPTTRELMGDVAVVDEPCEPERPTTPPAEHVKMGRIKPTSMR